MIHKGEETAVFKINLPRFKKVMRGIANAVFFKDFGHRYPYPQNWGIYGATLRTEFDYWGMPDEVNIQMRSIVGRLLTTDRNTNMPQVFQYAIYQEDEVKTVYKLVFYEGVVVWAIGHA